MSPDNKEICLVHLAQNIPQMIINLGSWEFVSFVDGSLEKISITKQIIFLVKKGAEVKTVMIKADPWKRIGRTESMFDFSE